MKMMMPGALEAGLTINRVRPRVVLYDNTAAPVRCFDSPLYIL